MNWVSTGAYELYLPDPQKINQQIPQTKGQYGLIQWAVNVDRRVEDGQSKKKSVSNFMLDGKMEIMISINTNHGMDPFK